MLDCQDGRALCLARDGEKQPVRILETPEKFAIEWEGSYHIGAMSLLSLKNQAKSRLSQVTPHPKF